MRDPIAASLINIVLDLLVGGPRMGVAAAAFATIASQTVSAILAFAKLTRSKAAVGCPLARGAVRRAVAAGGHRCRRLPSGVQKSSVISIANVIVQSNILNAFGAQAAMAGLAVHTARSRASAFLPVDLLFDGAGDVCSARTSAQCQPDRARGARHEVRLRLLGAHGRGRRRHRSRWRRRGLSVRSAAKTDVIAFGVQQAHTISLFYRLLAFSHCCAGILRGLGRPVVPMMVMRSAHQSISITIIGTTGRPSPRRMPAQQWLNASRQ